jgi:uncharacterized protein (DUF58 family)
MGFGNPAKFDFARQVAAALAYIALADLDRVAIVAFAGEIVADFPLARGKAHILSILGFLEKLSAEGSVTDLARLAAGFVQRNQRRGLAIVVSDLFDPAGFERGLNLLRHHRYEPHVLQVYDRAEAEPALRGEIELLDVEMGRIRKVTVTERGLRQYREIFGQFLSSVRGYANMYGLGCTQTTTEVPFDDLILRMMRAAGAVH